MSSKRENFGIEQIELHGQRVAYRCAGDGPVLVLVHGITSTSATWERVMPALAKHFTVSLTSSDTAARRSPGATTRSAPTRAECATCWSRWATSGPRSWGIPSAAGWRCSSPTSSRSGANVWS